MVCGGVDCSGSTLHTGRGFETQGDRSLVMMAGEGRLEAVSATGAPPTGGGHEGGLCREGAG